MLEQTHPCVTCDDELPHKIELRLAQDRPRRLVAVEVNRVRDDGSKITTAVQAPCELELGSVLGAEAVETRYALVAVLEHVGDAAIRGHWTARTRRLHEGGLATAHVEPDVAALIATSAAGPAADSLVDVPPRQWLLFDDAQRPKKISFYDVARVEASVLLYEQVFMHLHFCTFVDLFLFLHSLPVQVPSTFVEDPDNLLSLEGVCSCF